MSVKGRLIYVSCIDFVCSSFLCINHLFASYPQSIKSISYHTLGFVLICSRLLGLSSGTFRYAKLHALFYGLVMTFCKCACMYLNVTVVSSGCVGIHYPPRLLKMAVIKLRMLRQTASWKRAKYRAWTYMKAMKAMASVASGLGLVPLQMVPKDLWFFQWKCSL